MSVQTLTPQPEAAPSTIRLVATLTLAGLLSGLIIVGVFTLTLPLITANKAAALQKAVFQVLPGAVDMKPLLYDGSSLNEVEEAAATDPVVYGGYDAEGSLVGYAIPGNGPGFQDNIGLIYGFDPVERKVVGLQILESRETPGLGDKIYKDEAWMTAFRSLAVDPTVEVVKTEPDKPNQIHAITGATISSKAVVKIVNAQNATWLERLPSEAGSGREGEGN